MTRPPYVHMTTTHRSPDAEQAAEAEKVWVDFWEPILADAHREAPSEKQITSSEQFSVAEVDQIKRELADAHTAFRNLSIIIDSVTGGHASKPLILPEIVIDLAGEQQERDFGYWLVDWLEDRKDRAAHEDPLANIILRDLINAVREEYDIKVPDYEPR